MIKRKMGAAWILALMMFVTACTGNGGGGATSAGTAGANANLTVTPGAEKVLKVRFYDDPAGFDPANIFRIENENIAFNIFSGLTTYDSESGALKPDLAEKWETSDNKTWKFYLRKGVQWQKGYGEFTSADVLYSYNRILDKATASPYAAEFNNVESFEAPDAYTFIVKLKHPDANFLHQVANYHQGQIVKKEAVEKFGDKIKWNPVGTGPYAAESISPTSEIVLVRHDGYYKGPAPIGKIVFSIIKDEATATIALQNGEVDLLMRVNRDENIETLEKAGFKMNMVENYAASLKVFNLSHPALSNAKVRQAWAHAVDFAAIAKGVSPKLQQGANNLMPDWMDGYSSKVPVYEYNPEKAKKLLQEAGYEKGFTIKNLLTSATGVTDQLQLEQEYLKAVGINLEFEMVDTPTFNQRRNKGEFDTATRLLPAVNPDMILFGFLHPDNIAPKGLNGARYNNSELTAKLEAARAEVDAGKRKSLYEEIQIMAMKDLPYLPTYTGNVYWPGKTNVEGVIINKLAQVNFHNVDIK